MQKRLNLHDSEINMTLVIYENDTTIKSTITPRGKLNVIITNRDQSSKIKSEHVQQLRGFVFASVKDIVSISR